MTLIKPWWNVFQFIPHCGFYFVLFESAGQPQEVYVYKYPNCAFSQYGHLNLFFFFLGLQNDLHTNKFDWSLDWVGTRVAPCLSLSFSKLTNKKFTVPLTPIREWNIALREEDDQSKLKGTVSFYSTANPRFIWRKKAAATTTTTKSRNH